MNNGMLFIISAPSGAGKSSLIKAVLKYKFLKNIQRSISFTTRVMRPGEFNGYHYHFISKKKFFNMKKKKEFLEYEKVFDNYYGTSNKLINKILFQGKDVLLNIDFNGANKILNSIYKIKRIAILPPSKKELYKRLNKRNQDTKKNIYNRIKNLSLDMIHYYKYDYLIINDNFELSVINLCSIIFSERLRFKKQKNIFKNFFKNI
ncbi:guanylate kinase [Buchnera aphidicola]|uniref:guanylate kinase n=1 Tax=Buchnera aphidicola TaxID=9 RepID=UPI0031B8846D